MSSDKVGNGEQERRYLEYVASAPFGIFVADEAGQFLEVNEASCRITGYSEATLLSMNFRELVPTAESRDWRDHFHRHPQINGFSGEVTFRHAGGELRLAHVMAVQFEGGHYLGFAHDVTERSRAVEVLRREKAWSEAIIGAAPNIIVGLGESARILLFNQFAERLTGYARQEVLGREWIDLFIPEDLRVQLRGVWDDLLSRGLTEHRFENPIVTRSGQLRLIRWNNSVLSENGGFRMVLSVGEDVTDLRKAERERLKLEAAMRQQHKLEALGTLAAGVAHEINNPLNVIMNFGQLAHDQAGDPDSVRDYASKIMRECERAAGIVKNLLRFARHEKECSVPIRVEDLVGNTLSLIRAMFRMNRIDLRTQIEEGLPVLWGRPQQLQQVIMNLLTNARDALNQRFPEGDPDKVLKVLVNRFERNGDSWLRMTVEDHGEGIPAYAQSRVFDPFFTTKTLDQGTGLGLSISYGIVKDHGGEIRFETMPGAGSKFHVELPFQANAPNHP